MVKSFTYFHYFSIGLAKFLTLIKTNKLWKYNHICDMYRGNIFLLLLKNFKNSSLQKKFQINIDISLNNENDIYKQWTSYLLVKLASSLPPTPKNCTHLFGNIAIFTCLWGGGGKGGAWRGGGKGEGRNSSVCGVWLKILADISFFISQHLNHSNFWSTRLI